MENGYLTLRQTTRLALEKEGKNVLLNPQLFKGIVLDCMSNDNMDKRILKRCCEQDLLDPFAQCLDGVLDLNTAKARARIWMVDECLMPEDGAWSVSEQMAKGLEDFLSPPNQTGETDATAAGREDKTIQIVHQAPNPANAQIRIERSIEEIREGDNLYIMLFVRSAAYRTLRLRLDIDYYDDEGSLVGSSRCGNVVAPGERTLLCDDSLSCDAVGATWASYTLRAKETAEGSLDGMLYLEIERDDKDGLCLLVRNDGPKGAYVESIDIFGEGEEGWSYDPLFMQETLLPGESRYVYSVIDFSDDAWAAYPIGWS